MNPRMTFTLLTMTALTAATLTTASLAQGRPEPEMFPFATVDANKDGKVTKEELDAYRATATASIDANADGKLSVEELTAMHLARLTQQATEMATRMVEARDTDGDDALSAAELASRPMPPMLFEKADTDGDGAVTQAELDAMQAQMAERGRKGGPGHGKRRSPHSPDDMPGVN